MHSNTLIEIAKTAGRGGKPDQPLNTDSDKELALKLCFEMNEKLRLITVLV